MTNDQIRASDADRDRVAAKLRDHFAEGRLTREELDERITVTLNAKTLGDLRPVLADLPGPVLAPAAMSRPMTTGWQRPPVVWRGLRILPLLLIALAVALTVHSGGWLIFGFFRFLFIFWLVSTVAGLIFARRFGRRWRRGPWPGYGPPRDRDTWHRL
jgi:uncharacterized protein DUF1707